MKKLTDEFSQDWGVYKLLTHDTKQCTLWELENVYSLEQYYKMLEVCEAYDEIEMIRQDNQPKN